MQANIKRHCGGKPSSAMDSTVVARLGLDVKVAPSIGAGGREASNRFLCCLVEALNLETKIRDLLLRAGWGWGQGGQRVAYLPLGLRSIDVAVGRNGGVAVAPALDRLIRKLRSVVAVELPRRLSFPWSVSRSIQMALNVLLGLIGSETVSKN